MRKFAYIDVDDTLIRSVGTKRIPIPATIAEVRRLHSEGWTLYCWSSVGADYARDSAAEVGQSPLFRGLPAKTHPPHRRHRAPRLARP